MAAKLRVGATGAVFKVRLRDEDTKLPVDISLASTKELYLMSPRGKLSIKTASFLTDGTDGKLTYSTVAGDLYEAGTWKVGAHIVTPSLDTESSWKTFVVAAPVT